MKRFDDHTYYRPTDPEMRMIATPGTLAVWRHKGCGPAYIRQARRILYRGDDLNAYLDKHRVAPAAA